LSSTRVGKLFTKFGLRLGDTDAWISYQRAQNHIEQAGSLPISQLQHDRKANYTRGAFFQPLSNPATLNLRPPLRPRTPPPDTAFVRSLDADNFNVTPQPPTPRSFTHTASAGTTVQLDHDFKVGERASHFTMGLEYTHHDVGQSTFREQPAGDRVLDSRVRDD